MLCPQQPENTRPQHRLPACPLGPTGDHEATPRSRHRCVSRPSRVPHPPAARLPAHHAPPRPAPRGSMTGEPAPAHTAQAAGRRQGRPRWPGSLRCGATNRRPRGPTPGGPGASSTAAPGTAEGLSATSYQVSLPGQAASGARRHGERHGRAGQQGSGVPAWPGARMQIPSQLGHRGHRATPPTRAGTQSRRRLPSTHPARGGQVPDPSTPPSSQPCPRDTGPIVSSLLPPVHLSRPREQNVWLPPQACGPGPVPAGPADLALPSCQLLAPRGAGHAPTTHPRPQPSQSWGPSQSALHPACSQHASHPRPLGTERAGRAGGREAVKLSPGWLPHLSPPPTAPLTPWQAVHAGVCARMCMPVHVCVCPCASGGQGSSAQRPRAASKAQQGGGAAERCPGAPPVWPRAVPSPQGQVHFFLRPRPQETQSPFCVGPAGDPQEARARGSPPHPSSLRALSQPTHQLARSPQSPALPSRRVVITPATPGPLWVSLPGPPPPGSLPSCSQTNTEDLTGPQL